MNVEGIDDIAEFKKVKDAMTTLGMSEEEKNDFFRVLSGILLFLIFSYFFTKEEKQQVQFSQRDSDLLRKQTHYLTDAMRSQREFHRRRVEKVQRIVSEENAAVNELQLKAGLPTRNETVATNPLHDA